MAKTNTAAKSAPVAAPTLDEIKAKQKELAEQAKAAKEAADKLKADAKAAKEAEAAQAKAEAEAKETARQEAIAALSEAICDNLPELEAAAVLSCVDATALVTKLEEAKAGSGKGLQAALDALNEAGGLKVRKAKSPSANGEKRTSNWRKDGGLTGQHVKILTALSEASGPLTVDDVAAAIGTAQAKTVRWSLGSIKDDNRDPLSLMARGHVKQTSVDVDGKAEHVYAITKEGKAALKAATKE